MSKPLSASRAIGSWVILTLAAIALLAPPGCSDGASAAAAGTPEDAGHDGSKEVLICPVSADAGMHGSFYTADALPSGRCAAGTPTCSLLVDDPCPAGSLTWRTNGYSCVCADGSWSCAVTSEAASVCIPPDADAGEADGGETDAGETDGGDADADVTMT